MFNEIQSLPDGFLHTDASGMLELLGKPTLIHLNGERQRPLFLSTLLHGNETTGLYAIQQLLRRFSGRPLPRSLSIFIGNVDAASENQRRLDDQPDYNRIWPGTQYDDSAETDMARAVCHIMKNRKPFASIDIHNNTGNNPFYACINNLNPHGIQLAGLFSPIAVYFTNPKGVQSSAFGDFCPAIVLECGQSGNKQGVDFTCAYLEKVISLESIQQATGSPPEIFHTLARVLVPAQIRFDDGSDNELTLLDSLEDRNFHRLQKHSLFARTTRKDQVPFIVNNESNEDVTDEFFTLAENEIRLKREVILSMYTTDTRAIQQDCLCYFMESLRLQ